MKRLFLCALAAVLYCAPARADSVPVEISAAQSLEWNRAAKTYVARGDVVAKKGAAEIRSDTMTAAYTDGKGGTSVDKITAEGGVVISSSPYTARGDRAVYDAASGDAVVTGKDLRVETETEHLTARDELRFDSRASTLTASGDATAVKGAQTLKADRLTAFFEKDAAGRTVTKKIAAAGNIRLSTDKETITGDAGVYNVPAQQAELTGNVRITQGKSFLEGTRATVDMATGISQLFGGAATEGRVKGVFYPKEKQ